MPGPHGVLSLRGNLKRAFDCDIQAIQIMTKTQADDGRKEITTITAQMNPEELEIPVKKPSILAPQKDVDVKKIDLGTGDLEKTATINAHLSAK
jgi:methionyl-tRNA formyltransferase